MKLDQGSKKQVDPDPKYLIVPTVPKIVGAAGEQRGGGTAGANAAQKEENRQGSGSRGSSISMTVPYR